MYRKETIKIHKLHKEINKYIDRWKGNLSIKNPEQYKKLSNFKELYYSAKGDRSLGNRTILDRIKNALRFKTSLRTARALKEASARYIAGKTKKGTPRKKALRYEKKEITDKSLSELRKMSTRDIADLHKEDIKKMYHDLRAHGMDSTEAAKEISSFYFGS